MNNSLTASIDWIVFTSTIIPAMKAMAEFLGYQESDFLLLPRGANGYKKMYRPESFPITILTDGNEDMGIHVVVSSSAISDLMEHFKDSITFDIPFAKKVVSLSDLDNSIMIEFLQQVRNIGWFTRFDLAVDDFGAHFFTVEDVRDFLDRQDVVSKFRTYRDVYESTFVNEKTGHTIYFGSRQSEVMLRVYDKQLEQNQKAAVPEDVVPEAWIRWEKFVGAIGKLRLFVEAAQKTIEDKKHWLVKQCLPTIAGIITADGGNRIMISCLHKNFADR